MKNPMIKNTIGHACRAASLQCPWPASAPAAMLLPLMCEVKIWFRYQIAKGIGKAGHPRPAKAPATPFPVLPEKQAAKYCSLFPTRERNADDGRVKWMELS